MANPDDDSRQLTSPVSDLHPVIPAGSNRPFRFGFLATLALIAPSAHAQDTYPTRPIELIVPFAAGGGTDLLARLLSEGLSERLGHRVLVVNRPGANTNIGTHAVVKAAPDGYTLLLSSIGLAANPSLYKPMPFDPERDLQPISLVANSPTVMVVHPGIPATTIPEFVALLKARPGALEYASYGRGSGSHLGAELFQAATGTSMVHVPFSGGGPATQAVAGGHVKVLFAGMSAMSGMVSGGLLKPVGVASSTRLGLFPEISTFKEAGIDYVTGTWFGLLAPAATPRAIIDRLHRETVAVLRTPTVTNRVIQEGSEIVANSPEQFAAFIGAERKRLADVIATAGIQ
jgi:tripartite-type tricarboxylate transporter receptor subunit TctC